MVAGLGLRCHAKRDVAVQIDLLQIHRALVRQEVLVRQGANTAACHYLGAEALVDVFLRNLGTVGVVPARVRVLGPCDQAHHPGQLQHARGGQLHAPGALDAVLSFAARAARAPAGDLAHAHDDHHVIQGAGHIPNIGRCRLQRVRHIRQSSDGCGAFACRRLRDLPTTHRTRQLRNGDPSVRQTTGQIQVKRSLLRLLARLR